MRTQLLSGLTVFTLLNIPAMAQDAEDGSANRLAGAEQTFLMNAARGNMFEVELGKIAEQRTSNPTVKQFGQRMVTDHTKLQDDVKAVAADQGATLPTEVTTQQQATIDRLSRLRGASFDRAYINTMVADHKMDISEFENQANYGSDAAVKQLANMALPTLREHLTLAEDAQKQLK